MEQSVRAWKFGCPSDTEGGGCPKVSELPQFGMVLLTRPSQGVNLYVASPLLTVFFPFQ
ncbi:hypothetical protein RE428_14060 [Marinobacter nanhaiticus D15-8W]|nr:hypothetical protein RE428_14060 [Marinobacter nanhaiticus D15-8W]